MDKFKDALKKSYFYVNKVYLFIIFILVSFVDFTLAGFYFLLALVVYVVKVLRAHVPIYTDGSFIKKTYTYKETDNHSLKMDIWYPETTKHQKHPLVFFCHGGGWISGFRNQPNNISWCKYLASKGLSVCSIDYRYGLKNSMEDILSDYIDALNFVKENSDNLKIDKSNIVLMGLSAGGHLSLLYSTYNTFMNNGKNMEGIKGVVAYYSPSDLKDIFISENKSVFAKFATKQTLKADLEEETKVYDYYSPINWVSERMIPCLIVHGKLDAVVPLESSLKFTRSLKKNNIYYEFLTHSKGEHSFDTKLKDFNTVNILEKTVRFIKKVIQ